jgi:glycosyltransferase involved in cell wall biosynthesis
MSRPPIVSIIMPLYNKCPYVRRTIESIQQQTFADWELIIIDDGSTDDSTAEIPLNDKRIQLLQQENAGPAAARNRGIREARGEFITFLDADDVYYPHKLKEEMTLLHKEKRAKWMISAFDREENNETTLHKFYDVDGNELDAQVSLVDNALSKLSMRGVHIDGLCIDRHLLLHLVGGFNEEMRCFEITELMIRCALEQPKVLVYSKPLYRVIDVPDSAFKISWHRIEGMRQMGESLHRLSTFQSEYSDILSERSKRNLLAHVAALIRARRKNEARKYLVEEFPYSRNKKWWKLWLKSLLPQKSLSEKIEIN